MSREGQAWSHLRLPARVAEPPPRLALGKALGLLALTLLVGCRAYVPTPDARNLQVPGVAAGSLTIENRTTDLVCYVFITQDPESWGEDRLAPSEVIDADSARHFEVGEGAFRVRLEDCSRRAVFQREALMVGPEGTAVRLIARE